MNMSDAVNTLLENIKTDYTRFFTRGGKEELTGYGKDQIEAFEENTVVTEGKKYIKIIRDRSVWGFIVNVDNDPKFAYGDILKPANYNTPVRNAARGNVFGDYTVQWTGPLYLR